MNTKYLGNLTELQCITRFYELGLPVSIPYGDSEKYDMILDVYGNLYRLQCKHANPQMNENGEVEKIEIKTTWQTGYTRNNTPTRHKYSKEDYYKEHPTILFDTIYEEGTYQVMYVFR